MAPARPGEIRHSCGSPDRAESLLGFRAVTELEDGLRALIGPVKELANA